MASFLVNDDDQKSSSFFISLQELVTKEPMVSIPQHYIQPHIEPTAVEQLPLTIPVVDLSKLIDINYNNNNNNNNNNNSDDDNEEAMNSEELQNFHSICKEWGIFQLVNHGVSLTVVEKLKKEIEEFYKLPVEEKNRYKKRSGDVEGYGQTIHSQDHHHQQQNNNKLDWGDRFYMIVNPVNRRKPHLFPRLPSSLRESLETYLLEVENVRKELLRMIGLGLGIGETEMEGMFEDGMRSVRMSYYPPCPNPELVMGLTPHSDASALTLLLQVNGVQGLQIKKDGFWFPVTFLPDAFVVNLGDIIEILSNGLYKSIEHRATVNSEKERISIATFFNPNFQAEIGPSAALINPQNPPLFPRVGMETYVKDFFSRKLHGKSFLQHMRFQK